MTAENTCSTSFNIMERLMKRFSLLALLFVLIGSCTGVVQASPIVVGEVGDTIGTATSVDGFFDLSPDGDIFNSTTIPHVSISSTIDATTDVDWYSFTGLFGSTLDLDIDYAMPSFDATLALFHAGGGVLAVNDDTGPLDPGSVHGFDSFIGTYILPYSGTYYVAVSNFANFPVDFGSHVGTLTRPDLGYGGEAYTGGTSSEYSGSGFYDSGSYTLHISTGDAVVSTPEPATMALLGLTGLGGLGLRLRQRRKVQAAA
jgi:hypothetical protein